MGKLVIYGNGPVARVACSCFQNDSAFAVVAFTTEEHCIDQKSFLGLPVVPFGQVQDKFPPDNCSMFVAIGYAGANQLRVERVAWAREKGYTLATYISSRAVLMGDVKVGDNCSIEANTVVHPAVTIGSNCIIRSNVFIGHEVQIGDNCFIAAGVAIAGGARIDGNCTLGLNAVVRQTVHIGSACVIGAGVVIQRDTEPGEVYASRPPQKLPFSSSRL